ncbi:MAG: tol-pal system protein YbgF [Pseudomonadota bacterium]
MKQTLITAALLLTLGTAHAAPSNSELDSRLSRLESSASTEVVRELMRDVRALQNTVGELRGQVEEQQNELNKLRQRQRDLYLDLDRRISELQASGQQPSPQAEAELEEALEQEAASEPVATPEAAQAESSNGDPAEEREAYQSAFNLLREGRHDEAITAFSELLEAYPEGQYAGNAAYWRAESHYVSCQFEEAEAGFRRVIEDYPDSNKVADARLKLGYTYYEMRDWERSRKTLAAVLEKHPTSNAANLARKRLALLSQRGND